MIGVYIDEAGHLFKTDKEDAKSLVVAVCIPQKSSLIKIGQFHSHDIKDKAIVFEMFNKLLNSNCGILGFTVKSLGIKGREGWLQSIRELVKWVWRLLPAAKDTKKRVKLHFHIEQRCEFAPNINTILRKKMLSAEFAKEDPSRSQQVQIENFSFESKKSPMLAWADIVSYLWMKSEEPLFNKFKNSGLLNTCLINCDYKTIKICDEIFKGNPPNGNDWIYLMQIQSNSDSLESRSLQKLLDLCMNKRSLWETYVKAMEDYLKPESVRTLLSRLDPQLRSIFLNAFGWDRSFFQLDKASLVRFLGRFGVLMTKIVSR